jgi:hypothetical protein
MSAKSGNRTLIVVLCVLLGFFVLIGGCVSTCTYLAAKKAREYAKTAERNPEFAAVSLAASLNPELQVISKDETAGAITVKNKKTGEVITLDLTAYSAEKLGQALEQFSRGLPAAPASAAVRPTRARTAARVEDASGSTGDESHPGEVEGSALSDALKKLPSFIEPYAGARVIGASQSQVNATVLGNYVFVTSDAPEKVADFYERTLKAKGFAVAYRSMDTTRDGSTATLVATREQPASSVSISAEGKKGEAHVTLNFSGN